MICKRSLTAGAVAAGLCFFAAGPAAFADARNTAEVKAIFEKHCFECHGGKRSSAGVKILDREVLVVKKKKVVPNKPDESRLVALLTTKEDTDRMPPADRPALSEKEIASIKAWILDGAPAFTTAAVKAEAKKDEQPLSDLPPDDVKGIPIPKDPPADLPNDQPPKPKVEPKPELKVEFKAEPKLATSGKGVGPRVKELFEKRCLECHGDTKPKGAFKVLDRAAMIAAEGPVVAGKPDKSLLFDRVSSKSDSERMPPGSKPALTPEEIQVVQAWIAAGAPDFDKDDVAAAPVADPILKEITGSDYVHRSILADVRRLNSRERLNARYFSLAHLLAGGIRKSELEQHRDALFKGVNHLTWRRDLFRPVPVDRHQVVYRVDLAELGWQREVLKPAAGDGRALNVWDVMLLEYPYGITQNDDAVFRALAREYLLPANVVRPIVCVRVDWFVGAALQPPLYHEMLFLPRTLAKLEEGLGVKAQENVDNLKAIRAGVQKSGVSRHNRVIERHATSYGGYYWRSYDFKSSAGSRNILDNPVQLQPDGGEMIFSLPNGMQAYMIVDGQGRRLDAAPQEVVIDKDNKGDKAVRNGLACMRCHDHGMQDCADVVRSTVAPLTDVKFDKEKTLALYPGEKEVKTILKGDEEKFMQAMAKLLGREQQADPLKPVAARYLDASLSAAGAGVELALPVERAVPDVFRQRQLLDLGLAPLAAGQEVPREAWETYFDEAVRRIGVGLPVVPLDAGSRPNYDPAGKPFALVAATNKQGNVFQRGEEMSVLLRASKDVFIEVVHTAADGKKTILVPSTTKITAKDTFRMPARGRTVKVSATPGVETVTILASEAPFVGGEVMNGFGVPNRVIHRSSIREEDGRLVITNGPPPTRTVKKTVVIKVE